MRKETTYYAFDDTEFATEEACLEYERSVKEDYLSVLFLDEDLKPIDLSDKKGLYELEDAVAGAYYIKIINAETAERFFHWLRLSIGVNMEGFPEELKSGMWLVYDDEDDYEWYDPIERMKYYANIVDKLNEVSECQ